MSNEEVKTQATPVEGVAVKSVDVGQPATETTMKIDPNDKNLTSDDLKNFIQKESAKKVDIKPPEKDISDIKKAIEGKPIEKVEPEQRISGETKKEEIKSEPKTTEAASPSLQEQVQEMVKAALEKNKQDEPDEPEVVEPDLTAEDITPEILADPAKTSEYIIKATNQMVKKEVAKAVKEITKTTLEPFTKKIEPISQRIEAETISNYQKQAIDKFPELGTDDKFKGEVKKFITENKSLINQWHDEGKNTFLKAAQIVKSERLDELLKTAKDAGIKEGEERSKTAVKAFAEGGGKPTTDKQIDVDSMSADELAKYLPHKVK